MMGWGFSLLVLLIAPALAFAAPPPPMILLAAGGKAVSALPPQLVEVPEVKKHVMSGLTMNLLLSADGSAPHGRLTIRYEPWDEVFHVEALGLDGTEETKTLRSLDELKGWISTPRFALPGRFDPGAAVRIAASVVPFSASEEADAKRWLARSISRAPADVAEAAPPPGQRIDRIPSLFSAVIGSSIRRKPVLRYEWVVRAGRRSP